MRKVLMFWFASVCCAGALGAARIDFEPETFSGGKRVYPAKAGAGGPGERPSVGKWKRLSKRFDVPEDGVYYLWVRYSGGPGPSGDAQNVRNFSISVADYELAVNEFGAARCWQVFPLGLRKGAGVIRLEKVGSDPYVSHLILDTDPAFVPAPLKHRVKGGNIDDAVHGRVITPKARVSAVIPLGESEVIAADFSPTRSSTLRQATTVSASHDKEHVVFSYRCEQPSGTLKTGSAKVFLDDCVELLIDADLEMLNVRHLVVNSAGAVFSEMRVNGMSQPWESDWKVETRVHPDHWEAAITVPIAEVTGRFTERPGVWRVNFCRNSSNIKELSAWSRTPSFINARNFGEVELESMGAREIGELYRPALARKLASVGGDASLLDRDIVLAEYEFRRLVREAFMPPEGVAVYFEGMNVIPNPGFEYGVLFSGRAEPMNWVKAGTGAQALAPEPSSGRYSLSISETGADFSLKAAVRPFIDYTKTYAWEFAHKGSGATGRNYLRVTWLGHDPDTPGSWNRLKEIGASDFEIRPSAEWRREVFALNPPAGSMFCEFSIHSEDNSGALYLDDFAVDGIGAQDMDFLYPQTGYELRGGKTMIIWSKEAGLRDFAILRGGEPVFEGRLKGFETSTWGRHAYEADFGGIAEPGDDYTLTAGGRSSPAFSITEGGYLELARYASQFYYVQRQGIDVPGWHKANFLDDAAIFDYETKTVVGHRDVSGGWQDAGDPSKQQPDDTSIYGLAEFYENLRPQWRDLGEKYPDLLSLNWWGVKRIVEKCYMGDGTFIGIEVNNPPRPASTFKVDPAEWTDNIPGTADDRIIGSKPSITWSFTSPLAKFAKAVSEFDPPLSERITEVVEAVHALRRERKRGPTGYPAADSPRRNFQVARHNLEMLRTSMHLYRLTGEEEYREEAREHCAPVEELLSRIFELDTSNAIRGGYGAGSLKRDSFGLAAALFEYLRYFPDDPRAESIKSVLAEFIDGIISHSGSSEFGVVSTLLKPDRPLDLNGKAHNAIVCAYGYLAAIGARVLDKPEYRDFAEKSAQWILGRNPAGISMLIGKGHKFAATASMVAAYSPGHGDGVIPAVIRGIGTAGSALPDQFPGLNVSFNPGGRALSGLHEVYQVDTIFFILLCQELHKGYSEL